MKVLSSLLWLALILITLSHQNSSAYQLSCPCSSCQVGNCQCLTDCNSGQVNIYEEETCGGFIPLYNPSISNGTFTWSPEEEKTYYGKIFCDDDNTSNCTAIVVCSAGATTTTTTSTTLTTFTTTSTSTTTTTLPQEIKLEINPSFQTLDVNSTFSINVTITNVTDLFAVQFDLSFNSSLINGTSFTEGDFLGNNTIGFAPNIDNSAGTITGYAKTRTGKEGVNGSGSLARIEFIALSLGNSSLTLSNVRLKNSNITDIPFSQLDSSLTIMLRGPGDINDNGKVGLYDLGSIGQAWQTSSGDTHWNANADLNSDGKVDLIDLGILGQNWGNVY